MDRIVEVLLEKESMTGDEFRALLSQYAQVRRPAALPMPRLSGVERHASGGTAGCMQLPCPGCGGWA